MNLSGISSTSVVNASATSYASHQIAEMAPASAPPKPDQVLEKVMHPLEIKRHQWITADYITLNLEPTKFPPNRALPHLTQTADQDIRQWLDYSFPMIWSEIPELQFTVGLSLNELLALFPEKSTLVGSFVPYLLAMNESYLDTILGCLQIPQDEIDALRTCLKKHSPPYPNDADLRRISDNVTDEFITRAAELIASKMPKDFVAQHRQAIIKFLNLGNKQYPDDVLLRFFVRQTVFPKKSSVLIDPKGTMFQVTQLAVDVKPHFLSSDLPAIVPEFIVTTPIDKQFCHSSVSIPVGSNEMPLPVNGTWQGILQYIFGQRQFMDSTSLGPRDVSYYLSNPARGACNSPQDAEAVREFAKKNDVSTMAVELARRIVGSFKGRPSAFVPLLHSAFHTICENGSNIAAQTLWDKTLTCLMNDSLKGLVPSELNSFTGLQPPFEGLLVNAVSSQNIPVDAVFSLLDLDTVLKLFSKKTQNALFLRQQAQGWCIERHLTNEFISVPLSPIDALKKIGSMATDKAVADLLSQMLEISPSTALQGPETNSLHRFAMEKAFSAQELAKEAKPLLDSPHLALRYLGVRYTSLALLMEPSKQDMDHLMDSLPDLLLGLKNRELINVLLSDLERILPLHNFGALVQHSPESPPTLKRLREVGEDPARLLTAWVLTLAESNQIEHQVKAQQLCKLLYKRQAIHFKDCIDLIAVFNRSNPDLAFSIFQLVVNMEDLDLATCLELLPPLSTAAPKFLDQLFLEVRQCTDEITLSKAEQWLLARQNTADLFSFHWKMLLAAWTMKNEKYAIELLKKSPVSARELAEHLLATETPENFLLFTAAASTQLDESTNTQINHLVKLRLPFAQLLSKPKETLEQLTIAFRARHNIAMDPVETNLVTQNLKALAIFLSQLKTSEKKKMESTLLALWDAIFPLAQAKELFAINETLCQSQITDHVPQLMKYLKTHPTSDPNNTVQLPAAQFLAKQPEHLTQKEVDAIKLLLKTSPSFFDAITTARFWDHCGKEKLAHLAEISIEELKQLIKHLNVSINLAEPKQLPVWLPVVLDSILAYANANDLDTFSKLNQALIEVLSKDKFQKMVLEAFLTKALMAPLDQCSKYYPVLVPALDTLISTYKTKQLLSSTTRLIVRQYLETSTAYPKKDSRAQNIYKKISNHIFGDHRATLQLIHAGTLPTQGYDLKGIKAVIKTVVNILMACQTPAATQMAMRCLHNFHKQGADGNVLGEVLESFAAHLLANPTHLAYRDGNLMEEFLLLIGNTKDLSMNSWSQLIGQDVGTRVEEYTEQIIKALVTVHADFCADLLKATWDMGKISSMICEPLIDEILTHLKNDKNHLADRVRTRGLLHHLRLEMSQVDSSICCPTAQDIKKRISDLMLNSKSMDPLTRLEEWNCALISIRELFGIEVEMIPELLTLVEKEPDQLWQELFSDLPSDDLTNKTMFFTSLICAGLQHATQCNPAEPEANVLVTNCISLRAKLEHLYIQPEVWSYRVNVGLVVATTLCHWDDPAFINFAARYAKDAFELSHLLIDPKTLFDNWGKNNALTSVNLKGIQGLKRPDEDILNKAKRDIECITEIDAVIDAMSYGVLRRKTEHVKAATTMLQALLSKAIEAGASPATWIKLAIVMAEKGITEHLHRCASILNRLFASPERLTSRYEPALRKALEVSLYPFLECLMRHPEPNCLAFVSNCTGYEYVRSLLTFEQLAAVSSTLLSLHKDNKEVYSKICPHLHAMITSTFRANIQSGFYKDPNLFWEHVILAKPILLAFERETKQASGLFEIVEKANAFFSEEHQTIRAIFVTNWIEQLMIEGEIYKPLATALLSNANKKKWYVDYKDEMTRAFALLRGAKKT